MRFAKVFILSALCIFLMSSMGLAQMSGTYFINQNATGGDLYGSGGRFFNSFNSALDALWADGISSEVIFEVAAGQVFTENLQIDSTFSGTDSENQIYFRYVGANKPTIQPASSQPAAWGVIDVRFDGDYFLNFEGLKVNASNSGLGLQFRRGIRVVWGPDEIGIRNCEISDFSGEGIIVYYGGGTTEANGCENIVIDGNEVYHENITSTTFANVIGISNQGGDNVTISNNSVHDLIAGLTETQGIYSNGITDTNDVAIYNNFINLGAGISSDVRVYGLLTQHSVGPVVDVYHNSILLDGAAEETINFTSAVRMTNNATTNFYNNNVYNRRTSISGTGVHYAIYLSAASLAYTGDYNNFYVDGSVLTYRAGQVPTLAGWRAATGQDGNSLNVDPIYMADDDLHVRIDSPIGNQGTPIALVTTDYDGEARDPATPEIGADEYPDNSAPQINSSAETDATEDQLYIYQVEASDVDRGDSLSYSLSTEPGFLDIDAATGLITGTPDNDDVGPHSVIVDVTDRLGEITQQSYTLDVANDNDAPTISDIADTDTDEETATPAIAFTVGDIDDAPASLTLSGGSSNTAIVPVENIVFGGSGANRTVTVTPLLDQTGDVDITVTVSDGDLTANDSFTLTVNPINDAPVVSDIPNQTVDEGDPFTAINLNAFVNDVDNDDDEITWNYTGNSELTVNINSETNVAVVSIPTSEWNGIETITFTANDPDLETDSDPAAFTVTAVNDVPVITGQSGSLSTPEETALAITLADLTVTDIDNTYPDDFTLSVQDGSNYTHANNSITPVADFNGDLTVPVIVNDGEDDSESFDLTVSVTAENDVPVITAHSALNVPEETSLEITLAHLTVTDPDNTYPDDFTLSVGDGDNYTRSGNTITPVDNFNGALTVPVTVNDGLATSDAFNVNVSVSSENDIPVITAQATLTTPEETALEITLADLTVTDPDNTYPDDFTLTVRDGENYTRTDNTINPVTDFNGDLTVAVSVNDGLADSEDFDLTVSVTAINDVPVIADQAVLSTPEETALDITLNDLTVTDPDNTYPDDFSLSAQDGENYTRTDNSITPNENFVGDLSVPVTVNDGSDDSEVFDLVVSVSGVNDPPVISDLPEMAFKEDSSLTFEVSELLGYVSDPDTPVDELSVLPTVGENVTIALQGDTLLVLSAPEDWNGFDSLAVIVSDGELSDTASIYVEVTPLNDAPFFTDAVPDTVEMYMMEEETMNLADFADDVDLDMPGDSLRWQVRVSDDTLKFDFDPETKDLTLTAPDYMEVFTVTITVTDDSGAVAEESFAIDVTVDPTAIEDNLEYGIPTSYVLKQNYPNPFNPTTHIKFGMPQAGDVVLEVYNLLGQKIVTLFEGYKAAGYHIVDFDASNLPTGMYFYRIQSDKFQSVKKMMLVK